MKKLFEQTIVWCALSVLLVACGATAPALPEQPFEEPAVVEAPVVEPTTPIIVASPTSGGPATKVTVSGAGFPAASRIGVHVGPTAGQLTPFSLAEGVSGPDGSFMLSFAMTGEALQGAEASESPMVIVAVTEDDDGKHRAVADFTYIVVGSEQPNAELATSLVGAISNRDFQAVRGFMQEQFIIGYWRSEGVQLSAEEAIAQMQRSMLPASGNLTMATDKTQFPSLDGQPVDGFWGPDAKVVESIFSTGWGLDGQGAAILAVVEDADSTRYWHGMIYAAQGFD